MGELFVVADEAPAFHDPGECALDDPSAAQYDEPCHEREASNDLYGDVGLVFRPCHQLPGIAAIREDVLDEWEAGTGSLEHALRSVSVLDVGPVDADGQEPPVGVGQDMALAPVDALSGVITLESPF